MGFFSFLFGGKYPQTKKYEAGLAQHKADYERFLSLEKSDKLARYIELERTTSDEAFVERVRTLQTEKFSSTEAYSKWSEHKALEKSSDIKGYYKFKAKGLDTRLAAALASAAYKNSMELEEAVSTPEFKALMVQKDFKKTPEYETLKAYKKARKCSERKFADKTINSAAYNNYKAVDGSDRLKKYEALDAYVKSSEFIDLRREIEDPKRYQKSPECALMTEYARLKKDKDLLWYFEQKACDAFADIKKWDETFVDDFDGLQLDEKKWMVGYYWGKVLMGSTYSLDGERQAFRKENVMVSNGVASIVTRQEQNTGKRWTMVNNAGFVTDEFEYTSSIINTGASHRQQYGRFDFKVKASSNAPLTHNIWMVGEKMAPQINVASFSNSKKGFGIGVVTGDTAPATSFVDGANFSSDFYVISLLWTPEKLTWSVNGVEVYTHNGRIPQEPMYVVLSSNISQEGKCSGGQMDVDYVKCYTWHKD